MARSSPLVRQGLLTERTAVSAGNYRVLHVRWKYHTSPVLDAPLAVSRAVFESSFTENAGQSHLFVATILQVL